jgi:hypothetical protein
MKDYVDGCQTCQKSKPRAGPSARELHPFNVPGSPWEIMSWDMIGPLPESRTYNVIVTMVDIKTKAIKLEPADITIMARGAAVVMKNRVFREEGLPAKVISDCRLQFISQFMKELHSLLRIEGNPSTAYHPQTDVQTERINQEVEKFLRMFMNFQQDDWVNWLPLAEFTYNNAVHEATGQTPFFLNKGRHLRTLPMDPLHKARTPAEEFLQQIDKATKSAEESLRRVKLAMKQWWDRNKKPPENFAPGDLVLVTVDHLLTARPSWKLDQKWRGPFGIVKKVGEAAYELDLPSHWHGNRAFNEERIKRFSHPVFKTQEAVLTRPEPELVDGGKRECKVCEVLAQRGSSHSMEYLVRWEGYGPEDDTWELEGNLHHARKVLRDCKAQGRATKGGKYHVMANLTEEIRREKTRTELPRETT